LVFASEHVINVIKKVLECKGGFISNLVSEVRKFICLSFLSLKGKVIRVFCNEKKNHAHFNLHVHILFANTEQVSFWAHYEPELWCWNC